MYLKIISSIATIFLVQTVALGGPKAQEEAGRSWDVELSKTCYWAPAVPPRAHYTIDCRIDPSAGSLKGTEIIRFRNNSSKPIHRLALDWSLSTDQTVEITIRGKPALILGDSERMPLSSPILFELPEALPPGEQVELNLDFSKAFSAHGDRGKITLTGWHPQLWWGFPTHSDFDVKIQVPPEYAVATSGRLDYKSGYYHAEKVRSFGLFLGKGLQVIESNAGDVLVRCLFTSQGAECARLLLTTAVDVINFYRERFGFYPYTSLTIVPGMDQPVGGYPVATSIVAIHGQERMSERPEIHWRWIIAHEIAHQYWGEYVMEKDSPGWLWIGLGIYADREYIRARGLSLEKHRGIMARYIEGVREYLDTTVDRPPDQLANIDFDYNNVVIHGKGYSIISALACLLGHETFDRIYRRCLKEFGGSRLGAYDFRVICEAESQQDLGWFFEQWVRSDRYLSYQVTSQKCTKKNDRYVSHVQVDCLGTLKMPIPVVAYFQDGTYQLKFTDRLLEVNILQFESAAPLKEVKMDPDGELALVVPPPPVAWKEITRKIRQMPWTGAGKQALDLFNEAKEIEPLPADPWLWLKLGAALYDGKYYPEALEAFHQGSELAKEDSPWSFVCFVWQGHILDLLGRREEAIQRYKEALKRATERLTVRFDQYGIAINREWVEERIKKPFTELFKKIHQMPWTGAGKQALDLFNEVKKEKLEDIGLWRKLGLTLYDGGYYPEALEAFHRGNELALAKDPPWSYFFFVWQGHILDLLGRREEAIKHYKEAMKRVTDRLTVRHDQYGIVINREWVEERLKKPFQRR